MAGHPVECDKTCKAWAKPDVLIKEAEGLLEDMARSMKRIETILNLIKKGEPNGTAKKYFGLAMGF